MFRTTKYKYYIYASKGKEKVGSTHNNELGSDVAYPKTVKYRGTDYLAQYFYEGEPSYVPLLC